MGVLRPLVNIAQSSSKERMPATSTKIITAPTVLTVLRPIGGAFVAYRLIKGMPRNTVRTFFTAMTDNEGIGCACSKRNPSWLP